MNHVTVKLTALARLQPGLLALILIASANMAPAMDAATLRQQTGWPNGVVVVFQDGDLALDLGRDGKPGVR